MNLLRKYLN